MITTKDVTFSYPSVRFKFPDITCQSGQTLLITGESGKGKTTYLHILSGILRGYKGQVRIDGVDLNALSASELDQFRGKNIGLVLQESHFIASLSVLENLVFASWLSDHHKKQAKAIALLERLGLADQKDKKVAQLSIGQKQRVSIARALINEPKVLLADEPTSSLDDTNAQLVATLLSELAQEYKAALLIVTHDQRLKDIFGNFVSL